MKVNLELRKLYKDASGFGNDYEQIRQLCEQAVVDFFDKKFTPSKVIFSNKSSTLSEKILTELRNTTNIQVDYMTNEIAVISNAICCLYERDKNNKFRN